MILARMRRASSIRMSRMLFVLGRCNFPYYAVFRLVVGQAQQVSRAFTERDRRTAAHWLQA